MNFIDTHCHLAATEYGGAQAALLQAAQDAGVCRIVAPSTGCADFAAVLRLSSLFPAVAAAYGIHPLWASSAALGDIEELRSYLRLHRPVAVGEIGLDFFSKDADRAMQEFFFVAQLKLAREYGLPVLLHIRRAEAAVLRLLRRIVVRGGIAHAFGGSKAQADEFIALGFKLGCGGALTYTRATRLRGLVATLPLESIVLETDAPCMSPSFVEKGALNKPEYLPRIACTLAQLRGIPPDAIAQATTENALQALPALTPP